MKKLFDDPNWDDSSRDPDPYGLGRSLRGFKQDTDEMLGQHGVQKNPSGIPPGPPLNIPPFVIFGTMVVLSVVLGVRPGIPSADAWDAAEAQRKAQLQAQEARQEAEEKARLAAAYAQSLADLKAAREKALAEQAQQQSQVVVPPQNLGAGPDVPADVYR